MRDAKFWRYVTLVALLIATFLPRLTSLGTMLTVDEPLWQGRGEQFIKGIATGHFDKTMTGGQPGVITAWLVGLSQPWHSLPAAQAAVALATGALVLLITYALAQLWGFWWGMFGGMILALDPFLIAHSRVVHVDALFTLLALSSLIFLLLFRRAQRSSAATPRRYLILAGLLFAAALLSRASGILLAPIMILIIASAFSWRRLRACIETIILWGAIVLLTIFALWPALWVNPAGVAAFLTERTSLHVSSGTHAGETTAEWWYYARETLFRTTPIVTAALIPALYAAWRRRDAVTHSALLLAGAGLLFAVAMSFSTDKSDRYILLFLLTLDLLAVAGVREIQSFLIRQTRWLTPLTVPILAIVILIVDVIALHPYYLAHYNRVYPVEARHKLGWGEGLEQAADWIEHYAPGTKIASYYPSVMKQWYDGPVDPLSHADDSNAKYVVLYRSMFERGQGHIDTEIAQRYLDDPSRQPLHTITINHLPYVWIFPK